MLVVKRAGRSGCDPLNLYYYHFLCASTSVRFSGNNNVRDMDKFALSVDRVIGPTFRASQPLNSWLRHTKYGKDSGACLQKWTFSVSQKPSQVQHAIKSVLESCRIANPNFPSVEGTPNTPYEVLSVLWPDHF